MSGEIVDKVPDSCTSGTEPELNRIMLRHRGRGREKRSHTNHWGQIAMGLLLGMLEVGKNLRRPSHF